MDALDTDGRQHHPTAAAVKAGDEKASERLIDLQIYRDLYEYVVEGTEGTEPESTGKENVHTIRLLDAIQRSSERRQPPWPAPSLADAHASMAMVDRI